MRRLLPGILLVVGIVVVVGIGVLVWNEWDKTHYTSVQGEIVSITDSCEVWRRRRSSGSTRRTRVALVEESCAAIRQRYPGHDLEERRSINYRYVSPVDGRTYPGTFHWQRSSAEGRAPGQAIEVLAHKTEPGRSRHP